MKPEEHGYGGLAHFLAIFPGWGILGNLIIWLAFKQRSNFITFHARQAIAFQIICLLPFLIIMLLAPLYELAFLHHRAWLMIIPAAAALVWIIWRIAARTGGRRAAGAVHAGEPRR